MAISSTSGARSTQPVNIHFTGCPNSCAQHYCGDIGLLGTMVDTPAGPVEGYHVYVGGGSDHERELAREFAKAVPFDDLPPLLDTAAVRLSGPAAATARASSTSPAATRLPI